MSSYKLLNHLSRHFFVFIFVFLMGVSGCATKSHPKMTRIDISDAIEDRTGHQLKADPTQTDLQFPPGVQFDDGLTVDEAVAIALWNNTDFQVALGSMGLARSDLIEAGLLRNPILSLLFPLGPKQLEAAVNWAVEGLWQRPHRIALAQLDLEKVAHDLVQYGLDLGHRVRLAHTGLFLAQERAELSEDALKLEQEIAQIAELRLRAGDISELEASLARTQVLLLEETVRRSQSGIVNAANELRSVMGFGAENRHIQAAAPSLPIQDLPDFAELLTDAFAARPDLRAAEIAIQAAGERLGLEEKSVWRIAAILDINGEGKEGFEAGPGLLVELPVFNPEFQTIKQTNSILCNKISRFNLQGYWVQSFMILVRAGQRCVSGRGLLR